MEPKDATQRVLKALDEARSARGWGAAGWLDRKLGKSSGYVSRLLAGKPTLRLAQLFEILNVLELEAGEFFASVFGPQYQLDPDRILRRIEKGVDKTDLLSRIDKILHAHRTCSEQQRKPLREQDLEAELNRLTELRFSYPQTAKTECSLLLRSAVEELEEGQGSLHHLCDCAALLGSIERVLERFPIAAAYLCRALRLAKILNSVEAEASVVQKCIYLVGDQGDYDTAIALGERMCQLCVLQNDVAKIGQSLVDRGIMHRRSGKPLVAIQHYTAALRFLPEGMWKYRFSTYQSLGSAYFHLGEMGKAQKYANLAEGEHQTRDGTNWWKLLWLRGEIALSREEITFAETAFRRVSDEFIAQERYIDAAVVSLRLTKVFLISGRLKEIRELSSRMMTLLNPLKTKSEIASSIIHEFIRLALVEEITADFLDRSYRRIQQSPEWRGLSASAS